MSGAVEAFGLELPLVAPGVRADVHDTPDGLYIPLVSADNPGSGEVAAWLDALPRDRRVVFPSVINPRLVEMLRRRGFEERSEFASELGEPVDIMERLPFRR